MNFVDDAVFQRRLGKYLMVRRRCRFRELAIKP
jgi:hypothetical protein